MITIKLPYTANDEFKDFLKILRKQYTSVIHWSYNRFKEGLKEKDIRLFSKHLNHIENLDSWFIQSAIYDGKGIFQRNGQEKVIFGGRGNLKRRFLNKITNEQWKELRLENICSIGESPQKGNRKFDLQIIEENKIIFKPSKKNHFELKLPKLNKELKKKLYILQEKAENKEIPVTISLNEQYIYLTFDEIIYLKREERKFIQNRVLAIDLNPNYIGYSILDWKDEDHFEIVEKCLFDLKYFNQKTGKSSTSKEQKYLNNKLKNETIEISKFLIQKALHYQVEQIVVEDLNIKSKENNKGKTFNRLVNNRWLRNLFIGNLRKRCRIENIKLKEVHPAYSSFIGNLLYSNDKTPDPIASSIELSRRSLYDFYPKLNLSGLFLRWKDVVIEDKFDSWKKLYDFIVKKSKLKYRFPLEEGKFSKVFSLRNIKSNITLYSFI